ncbi:MAG: hypothetical protein A2620_02550 [Acidobacteria bacterium RIFCSPHIGHO2_01_FULL_67_28]|nr:MAG: hypothetical protein A2620_02550 [Acidobacteria bacterium RIFCSPHIGHO2_01_FULL_67_28]
MEWLRAIAEAVALFILLVQLPIPLFWLFVHPAVEFWRRHPRACYYGVGFGSWGLVALALLGGREWWLAERFSRHPLLALAGAALIGVDLWLLRQVKRGLGWRVLVGLPELMPARPAPTATGQAGGPRSQPPVRASGIYERVRHPRYLGMMMSWAGAVLLTGATRLAALVAVFMGLAFIITELEERELLGRLGEAYAGYRRRVPRFLPRLR